MSHGAGHFPSALQAKDRLSSELFSRADGDSILRRGIVGVGVAPLTTRRSEPKPWVLDVYVTAGQDINPSARPRIPETFEGMNVRRVRVPGFPKLAYESCGPRGRLFQCLQGGCSVSRTEGPSGTLGCFVTDEQRLFLLSASHVLAGLDGAAAGDPIIQAASGYATPGTRDVATLAKWTTLNPVADPELVAPHEWNDADAAIAEVPRGSSWRTRIPQIGRPRGGLPEGLSTGRSHCPKYGQETGFRTGRIAARAADVIVQDRSSPALFAYRSQALFYRRDPHSHQGFARPGDSGAIVWDPDHRAFGMVVASVDRFVVVTPWAAIESTLGVRVLEETS